MWIALQTTNRLLTPPPQPVGTARSQFYYHTNLILQSVALFSITDRPTACVGSTQFQACMQQNKPLQTKQWPRAHLNIYVILKTTDCGVISVSESRRWKTLNNYEFYRQVLSVHEWSHSEAWMGLCVTLVSSEASLKIQVNSPMRLRLNIRHGDEHTWPRYEPVLQIPCRSIVHGGTVKKQASSKINK